jgi:hypothetical protein
MPLALMAAQASATGIAQYLTASLGGGQGGLRALA